MVNIIKTDNVPAADRELDKLITINRRNRRGKNKYAYIIETAKGYSVRLSQKKPTAKSTRSLNRIGFA